MSLRSPGWVVCDEKHKIMHVYGLRQRQGDPLGMFCGYHVGYYWKFTLLSHQDYGLPSASVMDRTKIYHRIVMGIISSMYLSMPEFKTRPIHILIENYAYGAVGGAACHLLPELGGLVRTQVSLMFPQAQWVEKMPVSIKKSFTGSGRAKKKDMIREYHRRGYPAMPSSSHPWEDMVDGVAMVCFLRDLVRPAISLTSKFNSGAKVMI